MKNPLYVKHDNMVAFGIAHSNKVGIARVSRCDACLETKHCYIVESFAPTICLDCLKEMFEISDAHFEPGPNRPPEEGGKDG